MGALRTVRDTMISTRMMVSQTAAVVVSAIALLAVASSEAGATTTRPTISSIVARDRRGNAAWDLRNDRSDEARRVVMVQVCK